MSTQRRFSAAALFGAVFVQANVLASGYEELLRVWLAPGASVRERAAAVNLTFTNATPMTVVIPVLGTNFTRYLSPISTVWLGPGPEPRKTSGFQYKFGQDRVIIFTTAGLNEDPLTGKFTGAGSQSTNGAWSGQPGGTANRNRPVSTATNAIPAPPGSGR